MFLLNAFLFATLIAVSYQKKLLGSLKVPQWRHPHVVSLIIRPNATSMYVFCEGSIIAETWILTSATCVDEVGDNGEQFAIEAGSIFTERQEVKVKEAFKHPSFNGHSENCIADIALLELEKEIIYNEVIKPIELPEEGSLPDKNADIIGLGVWEKDDTDFASKFVQINVIIMPLKKCKEILSFVTKNHVCPLKYVRTPCVGLPGGPLRQKSVNTTLIIGVNCRGHADCENDIEVHSRVSAYIDSFIYPTMNGL